MQPSSQNFETAVLGGGAPLAVGRRLVQEPGAPTDAMTGTPKSAPANSSGSPEVVCALQRRVRKTPSGERVFSSPLGFRRDPEDGVRGEFGDTQVLPAVSHDHRYDGRRPAQPSIHSPLPPAESIPGGRTRTAGATTTEAAATAVCKYTW